MNHNNKYDYSLVSFNSSRDKIHVICPLHGTFNQRVSHHKSGHGCPTCKKRTTLEKFIALASEKHNNYYDYSFTIYTTNRIPVNIVCPVHGKFNQTPSNHLKGHGCHSCNAIGRYSDETFRTKPHLKTTSGVLYVIQLYNANELFYKIGITKNSITTRFEKLKTYDIKKIHSIKGKLYDLFTIEQRILKSIVYRNRYTPKIKFGGDRECFSENQLSSVLSSISEIP